MYDVQIRVGFSTRWFRGFCAGRRIEYDELKRELTRAVRDYFKTIKKKYIYPSHARIDGKVSWRVEIIVDERWKSNESMHVSLVVDERTPGSHTTSWQRVSPRWLQGRRVRADLQQIQEEYVSPSLLERYLSRG